MFIATTVVAATLLTPSGPSCQTAPSGAPASVVQCYDDACKTYRAAWNACPDADCRIAAGGEYALAIGECWEGYFQVVTPNSWVTFWYAGEEFGVSFDDDIPVGARVFLF